MVDPRWFDADAIADAGNVSPSQMQAGFSALRPTLDVAKLVSLPDLAGDARAREAFVALETWAADNIPFPGEAYRRYIKELYQDNELVRGTHRVAGKPVELANIRCPTLAIVATRDAICPPAAATALLDRVGSCETKALASPAGTSARWSAASAARDMYPALAAWLRSYASAV